LRGAKQVHISAPTVDDLFFIEAYEVRPDRRKGRAEGGSSGDPHNMAGYDPARKKRSWRRFAELAYARDLSEPIYLREAGDRGNTPDERMKKRNQGPNGGSGTTADGMYTGSTTVGGGAALTAGRYRRANGKDRVICYCLGRAADGCWPAATSTGRGWPAVDCYGRGRTGTPPEGDGPFRSNLVDQVLPNLRAPDARPRSAKEEYYPSPEQVAELERRTSRPTTSRARVPLLRTIGGHAFFAVGDRHSYQRPRGKRRLGRKDHRLYSRLLGGGAG